MLRKVNSLKTKRSIKSYEIASIANSSRFPDMYGYFIKVNNQSSLFTDDTNKISYLVAEKNTSQWSSEESLSKEFESVGFYLSNHPLTDFESIIEQYKVKTFKEFENGNDSKCFLAGTIMSIKEKKTTKGTSFAIIKFSDLSKVFELFIFSEMLENCRKYYKMLENTRKYQKVLDNAVV